LNIPLSFLWKICYNIFSEAASIVGAYPAVALIFYAQKGAII